MSKPLQRSLRVIGIESRLVVRGSERETAFKVVGVVPKRMSRELFADFIV
jgi:hypothetical protein